LEEEEEAMVVVVVGYEVEGCGAGAGTGVLVELDALAGDVADTLTCFNALMMTRESGTAWWCSCTDLAANHGSSSLTIHQ
jgi:hypothetical protein